MADKKNIPQDVKKRHEAAACIVNSFAGEKIQDVNDILNTALSLLDAMTRDAIVTEWIVTP